MNIDEYLNNLKNDLDNQLEQFGLGSGQSSAQQAEEEPQGDFKFCPECGTRLTEDANFCSNCGHNFNDSEPERENGENEQQPEQIGEMLPQTSGKHMFKVSFSCRPYCVQMFKADDELKSRCLEAAANDELSEFWGDYASDEGDYCFDYERELLTWNSRIDFSVYDEDDNEIYHTDDMSDFELWGEQDEDGVYVDFEGMPDGDYFIGFDTMKGSCWEGTFETEEFDPKKLTFERSKELNDEFPLIGDDIAEVSCLRYDGEDIELDFISDNGSYGWTGYLLNCKEKDWWTDLSHDDE